MHLLRFSTIKVISRKTEEIEIFLSFFLDDRIRIQILVGSVQIMDQDPGGPQGDPGPQRCYLTNLWWCWPPALPRPPGCFLCFPIRPWPWETWPRSFRVFFLHVDILLRLFYNLKRHIIYPLSSQHFPFILYNTNTGTNYKRNAFSLLENLV